MSEMMISLAEREAALKLSRDLAAAVAAVCRDQVIRLEAKLAAAWQKIHELEAKERARGDDEKCIRAVVGLMHAAGFITDSAQREKWIDLGGDVVEGAIEMYEIAECQARGEAA